tara:strand:+ start:412 stop:582 length:171 start_codon:yes stop_codon:yes gene_type:complete
MSEPYRITIEHYDMKVTVEKSNSDISIDEYQEMIMSISRAAGWQESQVKDIFGIID